MRVTRYGDPLAFHDATHTWLEEHESINTLLLGICSQLIQQPDRYPLPPHLFTVTDGADLQMVALMTPPHRLVISKSQGDPGESCSALVTTLRADNIAIPGVVGPSETSAALAAAWTQASGQQATPRTQLRGYELRAVNPPPPTSGHLRPVTVADYELLVRWQYDFQLEALGEADEAEVRHSVDRRVRNGDLFFWEDGQPVSMVGCTRLLDHGTRVGPVYTPPEFRRRGYASACVAALSSQLLAQGWRYCGLFANKTNPTANGIYQRIGYQPVSDYTEYDFS
jgi:uncharacterized protein